MYIQDYINSRVDTGVQETEELGYQCVAQAKDFSKEVLGITLGRFGGGAIDGWRNTSNTFKAELWDRFVNNPSDPNQVPLAGDIIFFSGPNTRYGHVACVLDAKIGENRFTAINQNTGNGDGKSLDDYIKIEDYDYKLVLGWYRKKKASPFEYITTYMGLPVYRRKEYLFTHNGKQYESNASYKIKEQAIYINDVFYKMSIDDQEATMKHEYAHHFIRHVIPKEYLKLWVKVDGFDTELYSKLGERTGLTYPKNEFINWNASRNLDESFAEAIEYEVKLGNGTVKPINKSSIKYIKYKVPTAIFNKFVAP